MAFNDNDPNRDYGSKDWAKKLLYERQRKNQYMQAVDASPPPPPSFEMLVIEALDRIRKEQEYTRSYMNEIIKRFDAIEDERKASQAARGTSAILRDLTET